MKFRFIALCCTVFLMAFASIAQDMTIDVFDENSCIGELMTAERALELLGSDFSVSLSKTDDDPYAKAEGSGRRRQKIKGVTGDWYSYPHSLYKITPYLKNYDGEIGIEIYYASHPSKSNKMLCAFQPNTETFLCEPTETSDVIGSGLFEGKLTNECLRLKSVTHSKSSDTEWVYLINF